MTILPCELCVAVGLADLVSRFNAVQQLGVEQEETIEKVGHVTPPDSKL